jgi:hypothetical protein
MTEQKLYPHGDFEQLAPGVWRIVGQLAFPLLRNMIVVRLKDGSLLLHSLVALDQAGLAKLEKLGKPSIAIVPHKAHQMDAPFYHRRYPDLQILTRRDAKADIRPEAGVSGAVEDVLPALGFTLHDVPGIKVGEYGYQFTLEQGGQAVILCDAFANRHSYDEGKFISKILEPLFGGTGGKFGLARIYRWFIVRKPADLKAFGRKLAAIPDLRLLTVSHGAPLSGDVAAQLREAMGPGGNRALHG